MQNNRLRHYPGNKIF